MNNRPTFWVSGHVLLVLPGTTYTLGCHCLDCLVADGKAGGEYTPTCHHHHQWMADGWHGLHGSMAGPFLPLRHVHLRLLAPVQPVSPSARERLNVRYGIHLCHHQLLPPRNAQSFIIVQVHGYLPSSLATRRHAETGPCNVKMRAPKQRRAFTYNRECFTG